MLLARIVHLEGENAYDEDLGSDLSVSTGCCSLIMYANAGGIRDKKHLTLEMEDIFERHTDYSGDEPLNVLAYVDVKHEEKIKILLDYGFNLLEILPGGHGRYEMALLCYTYNAHTFSTREERAAANL